MPLNKEGLKKTATPKDTFQFKDGDNILRILPPAMKYFTEDIDFFARKMLVHYNVGPEGSPPIACPRLKDKAARCPICETSRRLRRNPATKELAGDLGPRTRYIMNVVDMEHPERGVQVCEVGPSVYDPIFDVATDRDYGDVLDLKVGRNFKITLTPASRSKTGYNSYSTLAGANPTSVKEILDDKKIFPKGWKDKIDALEGRVNEPPSFDELDRLVRAATGGEGAEDSPATAPTHARTSPAPGREEFVQQGKQADSVVKPGSSGSPKDDAAPAESTTVADSAVEANAPAGESVVEPVAGAPDGAEACWGGDFQPSSEKCKGCEHKKSCMEKYVEG